MIPSMSRSNISFQADATCDRERYLSETRATWKRSACAPVCGTLEVCDDEDKRGRVADCRGVSLHVGVDEVDHPSLCLRFLPLFLFPPPPPHPRFRGHGRASRSDDFRARHCSSSSEGGPQRKWHLFMKLRCVSARARSEGLA